MTMRVSKDRIDMDDKVLQKPVLKDYGETVVTANSSTSYTIDLTKGNVFDITMTGNCSFTFSNPPASGVQGSFTLILTQDFTGSRTVTWPAAVVWSGGTEPTFSIRSEDENIFTFSTINGGTTWFGSLAGAFPVAAPTLEYIGTSSANTSGDTTHTHSSVSIGEASDDRLVVVVAHATRQSTDNPNLTGVTIGGVSATIVRNQKTATSSSSYCSISSLLVTSGTTADIALVFDDNMTRSRLGIYVLRGLNSTTAYDNAGYSNTSSGTVSTADIDVQEKGIIIAGMTLFISSSFTWSGVTEDYDQVIVSGSHTGGANLSDATAEINRTITCTSGSNDRRCMAVASWR